MENLDFFGHQYCLTFNRQLTYQNKCGALFTIITLTVIMICLVIFSQQIIHKDSPYILSQNIINSPRSNFTLNNSITFLLEQVEGNALTDLDRYISIKSFYIHGGVDSDLNVILTHDQIELRPCTLAHDFQSFDFFFNFNSLELSLCLATNYALGGYFNDAFINFLRYEISYCKNTTIFNNCYPIEKIRSDLQQNKQISMYFIDQTYDPTNYTQPTQQYINQKTFLIDTSFTKNLGVNFKQLVLITDNGLFTKSLVNQTSQIFDYVTQDLLTRDLLKDGVLIKFDIFSSDATLVSNRSYEKIQTLVAQIGGFLSIMVSISKGILFKPNQRRLNESIIRNLFEIDVNDLYNQVNKEIGIIGKPKKEKKIDINLSKIINNGDPNPNNEPSANIGNLSASISSAHKLKKKNSKSNFSSKGIKDSKHPENIDKKITRHLDKLVVNMNEKNQNHNINNSNEESKFIFSLVSSFFLSFCRFCAFGRIKRLDNYYKNLYNYAIDYTDVLYISRKINEIEKIKFVLFNKRQLSMFNLHAKIENPMKSNTASNSMLTQMYKFSKNKEAQSIIMNYDKSLDSPNRVFTPLDQKLRALCDL